jgi:hypothetical protein
MIQQALGEFPLVSFSVTARYLTTACTVRGRSHIVPLESVIVVNT